MPIILHTHCHRHHHHIDSLSCSILIIYIALSYVPQIYKIVIRKSTHGISPGYIFLSVCFSTSAFGFSLFLHRNAYECWYWMGALSGLQAVEALLGLIQAGTLWVGSWIMWVVSDPSVSLLHLKSYGDAIT